MSEKDRRTDLEALLAAWEEAGPMPLKPDKIQPGATYRVPVVYSDSALKLSTSLGLPIITHKDEPVTDSSMEVSRAWWYRVRELHRLVSEGGDPYLIWLALEVGAGTTLPDVRARQKKRSDGRKARLDRIEQDRDQLQARNRGLRRKLQAIRASRYYEGESFPAVCKTIADDYTQHGLEHLTGKQVQRICNDLKWLTRKKEK